jgi:hypothetical protein
MSYIQFVKPLDLHDLIVSIQSRVNNYQRNYEIFQKIVVVLKKFEGKNVTKRIQTALKEAMPGYNIYLKSIASMTNIEVWGGDIEYQNGPHILLCYNDHPIYSEDTFVNKHNSGFADVPSTIEKLKQGLVNAPALVDRFNQILKDAQELEAEAKKYELEYDFDICHKK